MPGKSNKLGQFWQELKRRKVIHVITVYASASFVIIELINNLEDTLNLPSNLLTIMVIVLAVGFPLATILSWLYDLTSEGVEKTKSIEKLKEGEKTAVPNAWRLATIISFAVIIGLVTYNIVLGTRGLRSGDIQSLAILPFNNYTGDDQLEWVAAGMHSSLIGDMGKVSGLRVLGETTSRAYKEANMTATDIAENDNVEAIVEPTLTCYGDMVCVQVKVVTTYPREKVLSVEDYIVDKSQILSLYNQIIKKISNELKVNLTLQEETLLAETRIIDPEAYDSYLMGLYLLEDLDLESLNEAREYLNSAIEKNPDWAPLYSSLAQVWATIVQMGFVSQEIADPKIFENLNKALELDHNNADSYYLSGFIAFLTAWEWEKAEMEFLKSLAANPNDAMSRVMYAHLLSCLQRPGESLTQGRLAIELDPLNPLIQLFYAATLSDFKTALAYGEKITADDPGHFMANNLIEAAAFDCGEYDKVMEAAKFVFAFRVADFKEVERIFGETGFVAAYEELLRQLEVLAQEGYYSPVEIAYRYMWVDQPDKALEWLEKGFEVRDPAMPYIATGFFNLVKLYDNPRFIAILEKMNLPLPE